MNSQKVRSAHDTENPVPDGEFLTIGFTPAIALLFVIGIIVWGSLSSVFRFFDRLSATGDLVATMDDARLFELTFTQDEE